MASVRQPVRKARTDARSGHPGGSEQRDRERRAPLVLPTTRPNPCSASGRGRSRLTALFGLSTGLLARATATPWVLRAVAGADRTAVVGARAAAATSILGKIGPGQEGCEVGARSHRLLACDWIARTCGGAMTEVIFLVEEAPEGGYTARALGASIFTEADDLADLHAQIRDAVRCHFAQGPRAPHHPPFARSPTYRYACCNPG